MRHNCWEFKKCGREPGGIKAREMGVCPAALETKANGINGGRNGGRACWALTGTLCGGKVQGTFAAKFGNCITCQFYQEVQTQETAHFCTAAEILDRIQGKVGARP